jgi:thiol-disulfide isomerase/thioredoxin
MSHNKRIGTICVVVISLVLVSRYTLASESDIAQTTKEQASIEKKVSPKTASLALPERTNNAWEMTPIKLSTTQGKVHTLSDWKGKVIMLNFWASWCAPCQFEIPRFVGYQQQFADEGLQIIGVGLDDIAKLKNVERSLDMNYPTLVVTQEKGAELLKKWGNEQQVVPYTVVIAQDGTIVYIHRGGLDDDVFNEYVRPLLGKNT